MAAIFCKYEGGGRPGAYPHDRRLCYAVIYCNIFDISFILFQVITFLREMEVKRQEKDSTEFNIWILIIYNWLSVFFKIIFARQRVIAYTKGKYREQVKTVLGLALRKNT